MPFIGVSRCKGPTPPSQAQPVGPKCHQRLLRDSSATKGEAYTIAPRQEMSGGHVAAWAQRSPPRQWPEPHATPPSEWIPVRVPALIDPETWDRAQGQLAPESRRAQRNNTQHPCLLRPGGLWALWPGAWWARGVPRGGRYVAPCAISVCAGGMHGRSLNATLLRHVSGAREGLAV